MAYMTIVTYNDNSGVLKIGHSGSFIDYRAPGIVLTSPHAPARAPV